MKIKISPRFKEAEPFVRALTRPDFFNSNGVTLHDGRNTIKRFEYLDLNFAVKRYGHLTLFNRLIYGIVRRSKAERAFRHASRLRNLGINTPEEVAWIEIRRHGLLHDSFFVSLCSDYLPMKPVTELDTQRPEVRTALDALTDFLFRMHRAGILHLDLNVSNILYQNNGLGKYDFQVIDTNRMVFRHHLTVRQCLDNLRRLSCPVPAYLYILEQYARLTRADSDTIQLRGAVMRLFFEMRQRTKYWVKALMKHQKTSKSKQLIS